MQIEKDLILKRIQPFQQITIYMLNTIMYNNKPCIYRQIYVFICHIWMINNTNIFFKSLTSAWQLHTPRFPAFRPHYPLLSNDRWPLDPWSVMKGPPCGGGGGDRVVVSGSSVVVSSPPHPPGGPLMRAGWAEVISRGAVISTISCQISQCPEV